MFFCLLEATQLLCRTLQYRRSPLRTSTVLSGSPLLECATIARQCAYIEVCAYCVAESLFLLALTAGLVSSERTHVRTHTHTISKTCFTAAQECTTAHESQPCGSCTETLTDWDFDRITTCSVQQEVTMLRTWKGSFFLNTRDARYKHFQPVMTFDNFLLPMANTDKFRLLYII